MWQTVQNHVVVNLCCTWYFPISGQVIIVMWLRAVGYSNRPVLTFRTSQWCERGEQANTLACYAHEAQSQGEWNNTGDQFLKCIFLPVEFLKHNLNWFFHPFNWTPPFCPRLSCRSVETPATLRNLKSANNIAAALQVVAPQPCFSLRQKKCPEKSKGSKCFV